MGSFRILGMFRLAFGARFRLSVARSQYPHPLSSYPGQNQDRARFLLAVSR
ncbi:hypothetical protein [Planktothrix agardhii]|uniref:hypothetical protein n=1 Tax=Planktothrix agardhii TaxID=1160 RepID=UPI001F336CEC|nr:hypothetical protein [Planktothrix agardhii]MCF3614164.1 hypothetical protein [Planktothrix agardhii 1027]